MQLPPGPNMPGVPSPNQMPGLIASNTLTASLQNQTTPNLGKLFHHNLIMLFLKNIFY